MSDALRVKWNLKRLAADLAAHLESLERTGKLWETYGQSADFLAPYRLQPEDESDVMFLAWGKQCIDCGDLKDYYMVYDYLWSDAGLKPNQCCCRKCLSARLRRPLQPDDFTAVFPRKRT